MATSSGGERLDGWHVLHFRATEALSECYEVSVELAADGADAADVPRLLGASCVRSLERRGAPRHFCGIVRRVEAGGVLGERRLARVSLVPAFWSLEQRVTSRIFEGRTVPQIVQAVAATALRPFHRELRLALDRRYPVREYCVQYEESDRAFIERLLAAEGIAFYFEHGAEREELVLVDRNEPYRALETADAGPVAIRPSQGDRGEAEALESFVEAHELTSTAAVVWDYDFTRPARYLSGEARAVPTADHERGIFEYPGPATLGDYNDGTHAYESDDARIQAELRRQVLALERATAQGSGNVVGLLPGRTLVVAGHDRGVPDPRWLLIRVEHRGSARDAELATVVGAEGHGSAALYENTFVVLPIEVPFRPARRCPPRIPGAQTAVVVGPEGAEIHTDAHGRVRVRFHWDRAMQPSAWIRVSQPWAGQGWGAQWIPRIGMEVVVVFLEGDPDRPLIVGCAYNGLHRPPYELPQHATQSGVKSRSTPGGTGYNELRFEDLAGQEHICVHAHRDLLEHVGHNHHTHVHANQDLRVEGLQTTTVGAHQRVHVRMNQNTTVERDRSLKVLRDDLVGVTGQQSIGITGGQRLNIGSGLDDSALAAGSREVRVAGADTLRVGTRCEVNVGENYLVYCAGTVSLTAVGEGLSLGGGMSSVTLRDDYLELRLGPSSITLDRSGIRIVGPHISLHS